MAFATLSERRAIVNSHGIELTVQVVNDAGEEIEVIAHDLDHAINLRCTWLYDMQAKQANICRIAPNGLAIQVMS